MTEPTTNWAAPEGNPQAPQPQPPQPQVPLPQGQPAFQQPYPSTQYPQAPYQPAPVAAAPVQAPIVTPRKKGGGLVNAVLIVAALVAVGGVTFAVGRATAPASASGFTRGQGSGNFAGGPTGSFTPGQGGFPGGFGDRQMTISGTVKSVDGTKMVITTASGNETTIDTSGAAYHAQAAANSSDVSVGSSVTVTTEGFGGRRADASSAPAAPNASGAPGFPGTVTATDVTITSGK